MEKSWAWQQRSCPLGKRGREEQRAVTGCSHKHLKEFHCSGSSGVPLLFGWGAMAMSVLVRHLSSAPGTITDSLVAEELGEVGKWPHLLSAAGAQPLSSFALGAIAGSLVVEALGEVGRWAGYTALRWPLIYPSRSRGGDTCRGGIPLKVCPWAPAHPPPDHPCPDSGCSSL